MGRKQIDDGTGTFKKKQENLELRPFCYYCDQNFDTVKTLVAHQRTKHFNCGECGLKFDTVTGLRVHLLNAYKRTMKEVPGAIPGRENPDIVVHGMEGLPKAILEEKTQAAMAERAVRDKDKAGRQAAKAEQRTAEQPPGGGPEAPPQPRTLLNLVPPSAPQRQDNRQMYAMPPFPEAVRPDPSAGMAASSPSQASSSAPDPSAPMPKLSPAVAKLLSGGSKGAKADSGEQVTVPGRPDLPVPAALSRLHPVALKVLAAAGALPGTEANFSGLHQSSFDGLGAGSMPWGGHAGMGMHEAAGGFGMDSMKRMRVS